MNINFTISIWRKDKTDGNFDASISDYSESLLDSMFKKWRDD